MWKASALGGRGRLPHSVPSISLHLGALTLNSTDPRARWARRHLFFLEHLRQTRIFKRNFISIERGKLEMTEKVAVRSPKQALQSSHSGPWMGADVGPFVFTGAAAAPACLHLPPGSSLCSGYVIWDTLL